MVSYTTGTRRTTWSSATHHPRTAAVPPPNPPPRHQLTTHRPGRTALSGPRQLRLGGLPGAAAVYVTVKPHVGASTPLHGRRAIHRYHRQPPVVLARGRGSRPSGTATIHGRCSATCVANERTNGGGGEAHYGERSTTSSGSAHRVMLALRRPAVAARGRYSGHVAPRCACGRLLVMPWRASNGRSRGGPTRAAATPTAGSYRADIRRLHDLRRNPGPGVLVSAPRELLRPRANMTVDPRSGRLIFAQESKRLLESIAPG